jgi:hypothetical protein
MNNSKDKQYEEMMKTWRKQQRQRGSSKPEMLFCQAAILFGCAFVLFLLAGYIKF